MPTVILPFNTSSLRDRLTSSCTLGLLPLCILYFLVIFAFLFLFFVELRAFSTFLSSLLMTSYFFQAQNVAFNAIVMMKKMLYSTWNERKKQKEYPMNVRISTLFPSVKQITW